MAPRSLYDKIWDSHLVDDENGNGLLYVDRHLVHEVSSPQAFDGLRAAKRTVRRSECTLATVDHNVPTHSRLNVKSLKAYVQDPESLAQCLALEQNVNEFSIPYFGITNKRQGIVHVIGPENGFTLPGTICVCGDSHTSTHGAFGCLAFGIGTSEVEHVLATQTLPQRKAKNMHITVDGNLHPGVTSKDVILHIIGTIGTAGATGCVIEYTGSVIRQLSMDARMSICNMSIEAGARAGLIAPDEVTFQYLRGLPLAPSEENWDQAVNYWRSICTDEGYVPDFEVRIAADDIVPTVTWGTSPQDNVRITGHVPDPIAIDDPRERDSMKHRLDYMDLIPGIQMEDISVDKVFIGSCTNSRLEDLRQASSILLAAGNNARVASKVDAIVVPGSSLVKSRAEQEGLDAIFLRAGFRWLEAGCSMCIGLNADSLLHGQRCASTSNRNFEGRQGAGGRTHLVSPAMAAATALTGRLTDPRRYVQMAVPRSSVLVDSPISPTPFSPPSPIKALPTLKHPPTRKSCQSIPASPLADKTFTSVKGICAVLNMSNVDTDMIIPKQFCKTLKKTGLRDGLFYNLRVDSASGKRLEFILDQSPFTESSILICTGPNFGCGSSREHAVWALKDHGITCVIAPSFGDIFLNNTTQNGMLAVSLPSATCETLAQHALQGHSLRVDLQATKIDLLDGSDTIHFPIGSFHRERLLKGLDDIQLTLDKEELVSLYEENRFIEYPWLEKVERRLPKVISMLDAPSSVTDW